MLRYDMEIDRIWENVSSYFVYVCLSVFDFNRARDRVVIGISGSPLLQKKVKRFQIPQLSFVLVVFFINFRIYAQIPRIF
jgi:hypothetical protein